MLDSAYLCEVNIEYCCNRYVQLYESTDGSDEDLVRLVVLEATARYHAIIFCTHGGF